MLVCVNGKFVAMELKKDDKEKPTVLQAHNLKRINEANGIGLVVHPQNLKQTLTLVEKLLEDK